MEIREPTLNSMMKGHMRYMTARQQVLAQNIANLDTPGYQARDLKKVDFAKLASAHPSVLQMAPSAGLSLGGTINPKLNLADGKDRGTFETTPTQNSVGLEDQMAKISDVNTQFQLSSNLMKKYTALYRAALGK